jgi:hypothetical protein
MPRTVSETAKPRNDAYTILLVISLLAMIAACVILFFDLKKYPRLKPTDQDKQPPTRAAGVTTPNPGAKPVQQPAIP